MCIVSIDRNTHEIVSGDKLTFESGKLDELQEELPDNAPRFILLSYEVPSPAPYKPACRFAISLLGF